MDAHADYYEPILQGERARAAGDLEAFEAQAAAFASSVRALEEGMKKQAAGAAGLPSEKDHEKQVAEVEEQGECGFCLFMKAGGCKDAFVAWEECVEAAQKEGADMVERCYEVTANLKTCMEAHADYYAPLLQAEQAINERAEAAAAAAEGEPASDGEKKGEAVPQQDAPASPASGEGNKGEAVAEKV